MRRLLRSLSAACLIALAVQTFTVGLLAANVPRTVGRPDIREERSFTLPHADLVHLANDNGSVRVRVHDHDTIQVHASVTAYIRGSAGQADVERLIESLIALTQADDVIDIISQPDERPDMSDVFDELRIDYTVLVPAGTDISVKGANGNVWISKRCGRVSVEGRNTDIEIVEPGGPVVARSTNGRIRVLDAPDGATIQTINGNVYAHMLGGALDASTTNGAIVARMLDPKVTECRLTSQNGGITLIMRDDCSATIEAVTARGVIRSDWPVARADGRSRRLQGTIGAGHTKARLDTLNGNIWIARSSA